MKTNKTESNILLKLFDFALGMLFLLPIVFLMEAKLACWLWAKFLSGTFGMETLDIKRVIGFFMLLSLAKMGIKNPKRDEDKDWAELNIPLTNAAYLYALGYGALVVISISILKML